ncbi:MAG TPA: crossover junction endodeoxyribonuclease RuvC [Bacteroidia bacterium]|nr:crossover junction endodeoxyribonuclease RuvC [Bacteroidia bacterium]
MAIEQVPADKIILGIDPGTNVMGYGVLEVKNHVIRLVSAGIIDLQKAGDYALKLKKIFERVTGLLDEYHPDELSIEAPFFGKNVQSMLKLGRAQGVAIAAAMSREVPVFEYSPKKIKQSVTGNGNASKEQVAAMLQSLLKFEEMPRFLDATDGLAAAVCHHFQTGNHLPKGVKLSGSWNDFVKDNPDRIS